MNNHVNIQHHDADDDNHNHHHHQQQPKQKNHLLHCYSYFIVVSLQTWNESEGTWSKIVSRDTCVLWDWSHASCFPNKFYWWHVVASGGSCQPSPFVFFVWARLVCRAKSHPSILFWMTSIPSLVCKSVSLSVPSSIAKMLISLTQCYVVFFSMPSILLQ